MKLDDVIPRSLNVPATCRIDAISVGPVRAGKVVLLRPLWRIKCGIKGTFLKKYMQILLLFGLKITGQPLDSQSDTLGDKFSKS